MYPIDKDTLIRYLNNRIAIKNNLIQKRREENRAYKVNPMDKGVTGIDYSQGALIELHVLIAHIENEMFQYRETE